MMPFLEASDETERHQHREEMRQRSFVDISQYFLRRLELIEMSYASLFPRAQTREAYEHLFNLRMAEVADVMARWSGELRRFDEDTFQLYRRTSLGEDSIS